MSRFHTFYGWVIFHWIYIYTTSLSIHHFIVGYLGFFHILTVANSAAVNIGVQYLCELVFLFSSDMYILEVELLHHMVVLFLIFWTSMLFSIHPFTFHQQCTSVPSPQHPCYLSFWWQPFWQIGSDISLQFWFAFLWWLVMLSIFSCARWPSVCILWKNVYSGPLPVFESSCCFFFLYIYWVVWSLYSF